jgi:ribosome-binding ATPase YchF (GTP1/OBG family)
VVEKAIKLLEDEVPIRDAEFTENEIKLLSSFQLLSAKKLLVVLNIDEGRIDSMNDRVDAYFADYPGITVTALCASLEFELSQMNEEDAQLFMADMNLPGFAFERIIKACYAMLGLNVFFTVGPDECRAWPINKGSTAYEAAGKIHTDIQRGFIRAVVLSYESFAKEPAESTFKSKSAVQQDEIVNDG